MSQTAFRMTPTLKAGAGASGSIGGCPFGSNCSCVFASRQPIVIAPDASVTDAALIAWTEWGWKVVARDSREIVLERTKKLSFCYNLGLTVVTGMLWLIYWVPRIRHPKIERTVLTIDSDGQLHPAE